MTGWEPLGGRGFFAVSPSRTLAWDEKCVCMEIPFFTLTCACGWGRPDYIHKMAFEITDFPIMSFRRTLFVANDVVVWTCMTQEFGGLDLAVDTTEFSSRRLKLLLRLYYRVVIIPDR